MPDKVFVHTVGMVAVVRERTRGMRLVEFIDKSTAWVADHEVWVI